MGGAEGVRGGPSWKEVEKEELETRNRKKGVQQDGKEKQPANQIDKERGKREEKATKRKRQKEEKRKRNTCRQRETARIIDKKDRRLEETDCQTDTKEKVQREMKKSVTKSLIPQMFL